MNNIRTASPKKSVSDGKRSAPDLTIRDLWRLVRTYFSSAFAFFVLFGLPYALFFGASTIFQSTFGLDSDDWRFWENVFLLTAVAILLITELPDFLERFGSFLIKMGQAARRTSFLKRAIAVLLIGLWWALGRKYPTATFWFSILCIFPAGFVIDEYHKILKKKVGEEEGSGFRELP